MGVPKFFRYISERYPCLSELAREQCIPDFDNLYLDMNGIIHNCSHPDDANIHFSITEEEIFRDIFAYIDKLFFLIKPQKLFFMAIDGVAPRAKMNQQRSRRFRSAKEAELLEKMAQRSGVVRENERFDSNCITPGTEFMERLHEALRYFIKSKITADPLWQRCRVILSGHDCPGEGEHKIMDYIRYLKSQSDFDPNTRHCLYGLDADLIILGLCTHELNFVILREEVKFGKKTKKASVEQTRFFLLHLGLLREYLEMEFDDIVQNDPNFDTAKLIDDWVLMGFLVGNDFIPHLPCLHISSNALPLLYKTYKSVYSSLGGNINENGKLNLPRLEKYFAALAEVEFEIFQENHADLKYFEAKKSKNGIDEAFDFDVNEINNENADDDLAALIESSRQFLEDENGDSDEELHINDEFANYKRNYYMNKLNQDNSDSEHAKRQSICYITALQWILDYYYRGVQSWVWYYPHHYAPFISDLKGFQDYKIKFDMGKPFLPFQQLLAVLPAASKNLLPSAYRDLMTSASSELIDYYPDDFQTDLNGKQHEWEAVVLIPFIDEKILLNAMKACDKNLTPSESKRNKHGPMFEYNYCPESQGQVPGIYSFKLLSHVYCTEKPIWSKEIAVPCEKSVCVELPNAARGEYFPGFPTMKHLSYKFEIKNNRVKVFDYASRNESIILKPQNIPYMKDIVKVAEKYLHQIVYIGWPHLVKAKVVAISDVGKYYDVDGLGYGDYNKFVIQRDSVYEHLKNRLGIEYENLDVLVHARIYMGTSYICGSQGKVTVNEVWSSNTTAYPAEGVVSHIAVHDPAKSSYVKIEDLFPENSKIFFVGNPYYGSEGIVLNPFLVYECGRLKVNITVLPEPDFSEAKSIQNALEGDYINVNQAASQMGINAKSLNRIIGSILVVKGARRPQSDLPENVPKVNIGLQLRYMKQHEQLTGYCSKHSTNYWVLSLKAIALVEMYIDKFPAVIEYLSKTTDRGGLIFEEDLFPSEVGEKKLDEIVAWMKEQEHIKAEKVACGSKTMEKEAVNNVLQAIEHLKTLPVKNVKLQVKPHLLLKPDISLPNTYKPKYSIKLFDRVVIVKTTYMVPLGSKGTVVGIYPVTDPNPVRLERLEVVDYFYEVLFDKQIPNGSDIHGLASQRVYKVPESSVLLIFTQDNKNYETFNDSKISNVLPNDNAASMPTKPPSFISQNKFGMINLARHESSGGQKFEDSNTQRKTQVVPKSDGGFWMPTGTTKVKHSNPVNIIQNSDQIESRIFNESNQQSKSNQVANTNIVKNESTAATFGKHTPQKQNPVVPKDDERFWRPNVTTKVKQSSPQIESKHFDENTHKKICTASKEPQQFPDGTQVLKSLLGLTADEVVSPASVQILTQKHQLPKPPTSWRSDAQKVPSVPNNFHNMPLPQNPQCMPSNAPVLHAAGNVFPLATTQHMPPQYQQQQLNQLKCQSTQQFSQWKNFFKHQQVPNMLPPQQNAFNLNSLNQKGAFIPLQVSRRNHCNGGQQPTTSSNIQNDVLIHKDIIPKLNEFSLHDGNASNIKQVAQAPTMERKKPPRIPKIGAKFDNALQRN